VTYGQVLKLIPLREKATIFAWQAKTVAKNEDKDTGDHIEGVL